MSQGRRAYRIFSTYPKRRKFEFKRIVYPLAKYNYILTTIYDIYLYGRWYDATEEKKGLNTPAKLFWCKLFNTHLWTSKQAERIRTNTPYDSEQIYCKYCGTHSVEWILMKKRQAAEDKRRYEARHREYENINWLDRIAAIDSQPEDIWFQWYKDAWPSCCSYNLLFKAIDRDDDFFPVPTDPKIRKAGWIFSRAIYRKDKARALKLLKYIQKRATHLNIEKWKD